MTENITGKDGRVSVDGQEIAGRPIEIVYRNWRGETARRTITPIGAPWWGATEWHPDEGWLFRAWDWDKNAVRDFALRDADFSAGRVVEPKPKLPTTAMRLLEEILSATAAFVRDADPDMARIHGEMFDDACYVRARIARFFLQQSSLETPDEAVQEILDKAWARLKPFAERVAFTGHGPIVDGKDTLLHEHFVAIGWLHGEASSKHAEMMYAA